MRRFVATVLTTAVASTTVLAVTQVPAAASTFGVTTTDDTIDGSCFDGTCSLREAVIAANASPGADTILVPAGTYTLTRTGADDTAANGDLDVTGPVTIARVGGGQVIIQAGTDATNGIDKVFSFNPLGAQAGFAVTVTNLTIRYGRNTQTFVSDNGFGGCVDFDAGLTTGGGSLTLTNVVITGCTTTDADGGGLAVFLDQGGTVNISGSTISDNTASRVAGSLGGGIFFGCNGGPATIAITNTTISGNTTSDDGGGIHSLDKCVSSATFNYSMQHVTISNNTAQGDGGGLWTSAPWTIGNTGGASVISSNSADNGGGIDSAAALTITGTRIEGNNATNGAGGGIRNSATSSITGSIIRGNSSTSGADGIQTDSGSMSAENNWWGCSGGPGTTGCDTISSGVDADPWLQVRTTVSNATPGPGDGFNATMSVNTNSAGTDVTSLAAILRGRAITWSATNAGFIDDPAEIGNDGTATAQLVAQLGDGPGSVTANVDDDTAGGTNTANFNRVKFNTTTIINSVSPNPSDVGQAVTVSFSVDESSGLVPSNIETVTVTDGVDSCTASLFISQCDITLTTPGNRTLTATFNGDANFNPSTSVGVPHTVNSTAPKPIYLVTGSATSLPQGDAMIRTRLASTGRSVILVDDDNVATTDLTDGGLVVLSSSVAINKVTTTLATVPVPLLSWEGFLYDDNLLGTRSGETTTTHTRVRITNPTHPIAAGLTGNVTVMTSPQRLAYAQVPASADVVAVAPDNPRNAVVFTLDTGDLLTNGSPAPSCRVGMFPSYIGASSLNGKGRALFDAAITWALACNNP